MLIDIGNVDWRKLRSQKQDLLDTISAKNKAGQMVEGLEGILALIDHIQDEAANATSEISVFGEEE